MAITIDTSFISQFNTEVKLAYANKSLLYPHVKKHTNVIGSTDKFQTLGSIVANTKTRNADLTFLEPAHAQVTVTLEDAYVPLIVDSLDELKTNIDLRKDYVQAIANAMSKKVDDIIIAAGTANATTITTTAGGLTMAKISEVIMYFTSNRVPTQDRVFVIGAKQLAEALQVTQLTSSDYSTLMAVMKGEINTAMGMTWVVTPDLPLAVGVRSCFAFHKDSIGVSVGQEPKTRIDYSPDKAANVMLGSLSMGAKIIDATGVVEIPCTE